MTDEPLEDDLRARLDPLEALLAVRPRWRHIPESTYQPQPDEEGNLPDPEIIPARDELFTDPAGMPPEALRDGGIDLAGQVSILHSALAWMWDRMEIRQARGLVLPPDGTYYPFYQPPFEIYTFSVEWDETPDRLPRYGTVTPVVTNTALRSGLFAEINPGSITMSGCEINMLVASATPVVVNNSDPEDLSGHLAFEVSAPYAFVPPYEPPEPEE